MARNRQLWGVDDVAAALDVSSETVEEWRDHGESLRAGQMPQPVMMLNLGRTPVWDARDVIAWAVRTGRTRRLWSGRQRFSPWGAVGRRRAGHERTVATSPRHERPL
jgi:hypothetical protein